MEPGLGYRCGICRLETLNQKSNCRHKGGEFHYNAEGRDIYVHEILHNQTPQ
jgi:hypothetical protein